MDSLKKAVLSFGVIGLFALFSFHEQHEGSEAQVLPPKLSQHSTSQPAAPTPTPSSSASDEDSASPRAAVQAPPTDTPAVSQGQYKDGEYTGQTADAFYGNIQVKAIISGGKITDVQFLQYPNDRTTSVMINRQAMPYLTEEAIQAQSAQVDIISGATDTSQAFIQSLASALGQAK